MTKEESFIHIVSTEDGSPTAYFNDFSQEKMHHSGGALGESLYIFGPALIWIFSKTEELKIFKPQVISVGTGLAYNEIITTAMSLLFDCDFEMTSYESNSGLNQSLRAWVLEENQKTLVEKSVYDVILKMTANLFELQQEEIKKKLKEKFQDGSWKILGALPLVHEIHQKFHVILYDLFSSKAMESFWTEDYLTELIQKISQPQCAFASYACTGNLKRALKKNGFLFTQRTGFLWKRNSSFASRK